MIETWSDVHTDTLEVLAHWKEDLQRRICRSQLILETIGLTEERQAELIREGETFKRCCSALAAPTSERIAA